MSRHLANPSVTARQALPTEILASRVDTVLRSRSASSLKR
jgi:hypothetical protein